MCRFVILTCIILPAFLSSCVRYKKSDVTTRQWHYDDGTLMKEQEYINDSIEQGTYRYFYPSGQLKDSAQITRGKFHGKRFEYHENGQPYILTNYMNNKERNGIVYRSDGTLWQYKTFNYATDLAFIIKYDSLGKMKEYNGFPIFCWVQEESYPIEKEFSIELLVADPPHCKTEVTVSDWDIKTNRTFSETKYTPDQFNRVNYTRNQNPEKDLYILQVANIRDSVTQTTLTDTLVIMVYKDGKSSYDRHLPKQ